MSDNSNGPPRGKYDPGWNDPPMLDFKNTNISQPGKPKLNLSKRIAFPIQSGASSSKPTAVVQPNLSSSHQQLPLTMSPPLGSPPNSLSTGGLVFQPPVAIVPPMQHGSASPPMISVTPLERRADSSTPMSSTHTVDGQDVGEEGREFCLTVFSNLLLTLSAGNASSLRTDEIQKRINVMNRMWQSGSFNPELNRKLFEVAKALEVNSFTDALDTHGLLVVNHSNLCTLWSGALRKLILLSQEMHATATEQNSQNVGQPFGD